MKHGSAFTGVGGFDLGLELAGIETVWQIENDKWCRGVLNRQWPDIQLYNDIQEVDSDALAGCDIISGGVPCQGFSIAGGRKGMDDERSGLFSEFARLLHEVRPQWFVFENVPGLLSSNDGRDMGAILRVLGELGYGYAWRVLDSQHFGVPQRRRRLFIVGHLGGVCPPEVLLEPEGLSGDSVESNQAREKPPRQTPSVATEAGHKRSENPGGSKDAPRTAPYDETDTARSEKDRPHATPNRQTWKVAPTLPASGAGTSRPGGPGLASEEQYIVGYHASDYKQGKYEEAETSRPLTTSADRTRAAPIAVYRKAQRPHGPEGSGKAVERWEAAEKSDTLDAIGHAPRTAHAAIQRGCITLVRDGKVIAKDAPVHRPEGRTFPTLRSNWRNNSNPVTEAEMLVPALRGFGHGWQGQHNDDMARAGLPQQGGIPRRLTPKECERLQGFPDEWTAHGNWHGLPDDPPRTAPQISDSQRYQMMGNAVTVPVAAWIGRRIRALEYGIDLLAHARADQS